MGLLTEHPNQEKPEFNKERIIQEIKEGLEIDFPHWSWLTTPDYEFDFILVTTKSVLEKRVNNINRMMEYENVSTKSYQIARGIFVTEYEGTDHAQECNIGQLNIKSARQLFNKLKEYDEGL